MAYEREPIPDSVTVNAMPTMREERIVDPYRAQVTKNPILNLPPVGQPDKPRESLTEEPVVTREDSVRLSPGVAALAKREQRFRQQQQEMELQRAKLAQETTEIAQIKALKEKLAAKDYSALDGVVDYNEYSQYQVNKLNGTDPVQEELKKLTGKVSEIEKRAEENISKQFDAAVNERRIATKELVDKSESFPRIKKANAHEAVVQHILDTWEHDNEELSVDQAAKEVEEILIERAKMWAALLEDEKAAQVEGEKKPLPPLKQGLKTLTNQVTAGDIKARRSYQGLSDSERWAEARRRAEARLQNPR